MKLEPGTELAGRYRAQAPLGRGGMGEVWRCLDLEQDRPVAVKFVPEGAREGMGRLFRDEVIATAHLRHPGIVGIYDLVRLGSGLALVMELCDGQPLSRIADRSFASLRPVLLQILEALAHAHARGVLHLDIKPDNVMFHWEGERLRVKLLDFGIAQAWRGGPRMADRGAAVMGTVPYMPPEQLLPGFGALGPWSDLYAFGAMTHHLLSGERPFATKDPAERILRPPPRIDPVSTGVPRELPDLVASLIRPRERDRPTHAADVIAALRELPDVGEPPTRTVELLAVEERPAETLLTATTTAVDLPFTQRPVSIAFTGASPPPPTADLPEDTPHPVDQPGPGAYALVGLVEPGLSGRNAERGRIWRELVRARASGEVRVVEILGPVGVGKSRLARDTLELAHQHGLGHTAWTSWYEGRAAWDGLRGLLDNILMTEGASTAEALRDRVVRWAERFPGEDDERFVREALAALDGSRVSGADPDLLLRTVVEALARASERRAVVVSCDDVHRGGPAPGALVERLRRRDLAVAVLATAPEGTLSDPDLRVALSPLDDGATRRLVQEVLEVDEDLARRISARSGGNPLLTTQLVAELVAGRKLRREAGRHGLRPDVDPAALPEDLPALWDARLVRSGADPVALGALALVRPRVGSEVLERLGERVPGLHASVDAAMRAGLVRRRDGVTAWVHSSLRSHLCERLPEARRVALHDTAAFALEVLVGREDVQHERAAHLHGAGRAEEACAAMTEAIAWSLRRAEAEERRSRSETLLRWARASGLGRHEARALAELAHAAAADGRHEEARTTIERAVAVERDAGPPGAWVTWRRAQVARYAVDAEVAREASLAALELARAEGETEVESHALGQLALDSHRRRDFDTARERFEAAARIARARGDRATEARALLHLANLAPTESVDLFDRAVSLATEAGDSRVELTARQVRADALFLLGERERAGDEMRVVASRARALGIRPLVAVVEIQLACWALQDRDLPRARAQYRAIVDAGAARGSVTERSMCAAVDAAISALSGEEARAADALRRLAACRGDNDEPELRQVLEIGAEAATGALARAFAEALGHR